MKRFLPLLALAPLAFLWSCGNPALPVVKPELPAVVQQELPDLKDRFPAAPAPEWQCVGPKDTRSPNCADGPPAPKAKPKAKKKTQHHVKRKPKPITQSPPVETEPVPPQPNVRCLFDFISPCTPGGAF